MSRLIAKIVFSGLVIAWRRAGCPTSTSPELAKATTDGVVRDPSGFSITLALPPSITATQEKVVPRSTPMTLAIQHLRHRSEAAPVRGGSPVSLLNAIILLRFPF